MGEVRGFGITHYPPLVGTDETMISTLERNLRAPGTPDIEKEPSSWPAPMQAEWNDRLGSAARHRAELIENMDKVREALDAFNPDVVIMWGDDQYELFREEAIPSFSVLALDGTIVNPFASKSPYRPDVWGEGAEKELKIHMDGEIGRYFATALLESNFDVAYSYKTREGVPFPHAFLNALLYLDYHRDNPFEYTLLPIAVNCYGRHVIANRGGGVLMGEEPRLDPPSPSPDRCMQLGAAIARIAQASPYKVALMASSGWSHAFLNDKSWRLQPDVAADKNLYKALVDQDYATWHNYKLANIEDAGQQECLNWFCLLGAMEELQRKPLYSHFVECYTFNSSKVFAIYE